MDIQRKYMTVTMDVVPEGFSFQCWISTEEFWQFDKLMFPHVYTHVSDACTWFIRSNNELTNKVVSVAAETADKMCAEAIAHDKRRKIANR